MKNTFFLICTLFFLVSCGVKVPYTDELRNEFSLDTDEKMRNVQFSISQTIILDQEYKLENQNTTENGTLIAFSNSKKEALIIPAGTKCIFEEFGANGEIKVRFELGDDKYLVFSSKSDVVRNRRFTLQADWAAQGGPKINYGGNVFRIDLQRGFNARSSYLQVLKRNLQKNRRKDRIIKGLKV